jgi:hypothetical protein
MVIAWTAGLEVAIMALLFVLAVEPAPEAGVPLPDAQAAVTAKVTSRLAYRRLLLMDMSQIVRVEGDNYLVHATYH